MATARNPVTKQLYDVLYDEILVHDPPVTGMVGAVSPVVMAVRPHKTTHRISIPLKGLVSNWAPNVVSTSPPITNNLWFSLVSDVPVVVQDTSTQPYLMAFSNSVSFEDVSIQ